MCVCVCVLDGGLDEMMDEMSGGKCLYAFMRVIDPNTQLPKNVLINWVGPYCSHTHTHSTQKDGDTFHVCVWHVLVWKQSVCVDFCVRWQTKQGLGYSTHSQLLFSPTARRRSPGHKEGGVCSPHSRRLQFLFCKPHYCFSHTTQHTHTCV